MSYPLTCCRYLSQLMNSRSWGSWSLWVLTYCHRAWMMTGLVWVWIPSIRASRGSSLNWGGWIEARWICHLIMVSLIRLAIKLINVWRTHAGNITIPLRGSVNTSEITLEHLPGSQAWAGRCSEHPHHRASSPGNHQSPGWWQSCATKMTYKIFLNKRSIYVMKSLIIKPAGLIKSVW